MIIAYKILQRAIAATVAHHGSDVVKLVQKYDSSVKTNISIGDLFNILVPLFESNNEFNKEFSLLMINTKELKLFNGKEALGGIIGSVAGIIGGAFASKAAVANSQASKAASSASTANSLSQITVAMKTQETQTAKNANYIQLAIIGSILVLCAIVLIKKLKE